MSGTKATKTCLEEIDLTERFSSQMAHLCLNSDYADIELIVEDQRLPAHRVILAARSEYFRALLYGGLSESTQREIKMKIPLEAFKALLRYIYSGHMSFFQMSEDVIIDVLGLANQFGFTELEMAIAEYLPKYLSLDNICTVLDAARLYNLTDLSNVCMTFMDRNASSILQHETFKMLSKNTLQEVLRRDSFFAPEFEIFIGVLEWCLHHDASDVEAVIKDVRLPLIKLEKLLQVVRPSGIFSADQLLDAITEQSSLKHLPYRAMLWPEENVATEKFQARTIEGQCRTELLNGDITTYDMEKGYTRHAITDGNDTGIIVELGTICLINYVKILLWDGDNRSYSYYMEVGVDMNRWERVIDYSKYYCRSWQFLYFPARAVKYIKLVGTHNTDNRIFHVVSLEAMYTAAIPKLINDIVAPVSNVATIEMSGIVVNGVSRTRNALLNGDYINYDWDSGYTCHQLGSGDILVRLGQPYFIGSMRLLLWDGDDRTYSFYVETSINEKDWEVVVDKRDEQVKSWQNCSFTPRAVIFIRIIGTHNTANEIFHIVHLECPSQDPTYLQMEKEKLRQLGAVANTSKMSASPSNGNHQAMDKSEALIQFDHGSVDG